jgi:transcriptional regulator with XRE-family HTH domain
MMNPFVLGKKIKQSRINHGMTQSQLAEKLGISYQQIQKYENGDSQMSVSRFFEIAMALETDPLALLEDIVFTSKISEPRRGYKTPAKNGSQATAQEKQLIENYRKIKSTVIKDDILKLIKSLAMTRIR